MLKRNPYQILIAAMLLCMVCFTNNGRAQVLPDLQNNFTAWQKDNLCEKLFMHINKSFYLTGEILWFKIYCVDGGTNKPIDLSKVAYVELLDNNHTPVMQTKVGLKDGKGNGSLYLPFSLSNGNYQIRAYTSWMKNFDASGFFESQVAIINPVKTMPSEIKQTKAVYDVQFFPEGGRLVKGITSKVAFKITGADGKGTSCTGALINRHNDTVARFSSLKFGMGSFNLKPAADEVYRAVIKVNKDTVPTKTLPGIQSSGYVMAVADAGEKWDVRIQNADSSSRSVVYAIVHTNYAIKLAERLQLINGKAGLGIDKSKLDEGVNIITLFDDQRRPLAERLVFKRPGKKLVIDAHTAEPVYGTRKKVNLAVSIPDQNKDDRAADISVSVYRADDLQNTDPEHISGYFWLRSNLKGYIESPDYYLENDNKAADEALDNLMLTQGWSEFDWSKVTAGAAPVVKFLPEYTEPVITAHISDAATKTPGKNITAYLTIHGKPDQLFVAKSDSTGNLLFNTLNFYGSHELFVQTNSLRDSTFHIDIVNPFDERHSTAHITPLSLTGDMKNLLADNSINVQVQNIFAMDQLKQFTDQPVDSTSFYGKPYKTYKLDDYTRFPTMEEVLREYVTSIAVFKRQGKFDIKMFDVDKLLGRPLVLLDGVPIFDEDKIFKVDPLKITKLEMVTKNYQYGTSLFNGVMSFSSYKGDRANFEINPSAVVLDYEGLQRERKFYSPVYNSDEQLNSPIPDFRTVLYWNPNAGTRADGKADLDFYTGDKPGRYVGIIEGIAGNGETGSRVFYFEVKK
ncbi:MAG: hypothetical protein ACXVJB_01715 [Mucilaginibacter sp.]